MDEDLALPLAVATGGRLTNIRGGAPITAGGPVTGALGVAGGHLPVPPHPGPAASGVTVMISLLTSNWSDTGDPCSSRRPARTTCRARSVRRGTAAADRRSTASPPSSHGQSSRAASSRRRGPQGVDVRYTRSTQRLCRALPSLLCDRCAGRAPSNPGQPQAPVPRRCATTEARSPRAAACRFRDCDVPPGPVHGCPCDGPPRTLRPRTYGVQRRRGKADPVVFVQVMAIWWGAEERSVKPSAQPTLVRTQHLPPPAKTAR